MTNNRGVSGRSRPRSGRGSYTPSLARVFPWDFDMRALRTRRRLIRCATTAYSFSSGRNGFECRERKAVVDRPTRKSASDAVHGAAAVMAEPDVPALRLLRHLRRLEAPESNQAQSANKEREKQSGMSYGAHMAIQTAIGFLFLGGSVERFRLKMMQSHIF